MKTRINIIICLFILSLGCTSCGEYEALEIDKDARRVADSLFRAHRDSLTVFSDTLCAQNHRKLLSIYLDSIQIIERNKIEKLIKK